MALLELQEDRNAWSSAKVEQLMVEIDEGNRPRSTPFYEGNPILRKGNIIFDYTDLEVAELQRCSTDIVYFANKFCTVMTDEGLMTIKLRGYQEEMLRHFQANRFSVCLASRQIGKCLEASTLIKLKITNKILEDKLKMFRLSDNIFMLPMFELYYATKEHNFIDKIKYILYKTLFSLSRS